MRCSRCIWKIENHLISQGFAKEASVNLGENLLEVCLPDNKGSFSKVAHEVEALGFKVHPIDNSDSLKAKNRQLDRDLMLRLGVAAAASGNIMILVTCPG